MYRDRGMFMHSEAGWGGERHLSANTSEFLQMSCFFFIYTFFRVREFSRLEWLRS